MKKLIKGPPDDIIGWYNLNISNTEFKSGQWIKEYINKNDYCLWFDSIDKTLQFYISFKNNADAVAYKLTWM
jgi:hypothetical protein